MATTQLAPPGVGAEAELADAVLQQTAVRGEHLGPHPDGPAVGTLVRTVGFIVGLVVIPIWLVIRLLSAFGRGSNSTRN